VVEELKELGFKSLYHYKKNEPQGNELIGTYFHHKKENQAHHIDYIFLAHNLLSQSTFEIGVYKDWIEVSDHIPLSLMISKI
jgi:endonuclease/exonuclease/phosphatase family metal-dependent hydrolase